RRGCGGADPDLVARNRQKTYHQGHGSPHSALSDPRRDKQTRCRPLLCRGAPEPAGAQTHRLPCPFRLVGVANIRTHVLREDQKDKRERGQTSDTSRLRLPAWAEAHWEKWIGTNRAGGAAKDLHLRWRNLGLPAKLLAMTLAFVLIAEILVFLPAI